jgi:membrane protein
VRAKTFLRRFGDEFKKDNLGDVAAMMTYFAIFALFPMMVFVLTVALLVVPQGVIQQGLDMVSQTMPGQAAAIIEQHVVALQSAAGGGIAVGAILLALWGASRGTVALGRALNTVYSKQETRPWWKVQLIAIGATAAVAVMLILALALLAVGPLVGRFIADRFGLGAVFEILWNVGRWIAAAALVMVIWSVLYKILPNTDAPFRVFTPGAIVGVLLWVGASLLFALYVGNFGKYEKTYGALGAVIIFLTWLWISNLALLVGAEINKVRETDEEKHLVRTAGKERRDERVKHSPLPPQPRPA